MRCGAPYDAGGKANVISELRVWIGGIRQGYPRDRGRSCRNLVVCALVALAATAGPASAQGEIKFSSVDEAFHQGAGAYVRGQYEIAVPALEAATRMGAFYAPFYLARIYSGSHPAYLDQARAYHLYEQIVSKYAGVVDPADVRRAPTVAKAMTAMAKYLLNGLPDAGVRPDRRRAISLLRYAATYYGEDDAQFELARLQLTGDNNGRSVRAALYRLSRLAKRCHAGAQATLANLMWLGRYPELLQGDSGEALALATRAVQCAPAHERMWIKDIHQRIFCGVSDKMRRKAEGEVAGWDQRFGGVTRPSAAGVQALGTLNEPVRTCANGDRIPDGSLTPPSTVTAGTSASGGATAVGLTRDRGGESNKAAPTPMLGQTLGFGSGAPRDGMMRAGMRDESSPVEAPPAGFGFITPPGN